MKNIRLTLATLVTAALFALSSSPALALTNSELAGVYKGTSTSTSTFADGRTLTANVKLTFKKGGTIKNVATINGQTITAKGKYQFASENLILGTFPTSEFTAFASVDGNALTFIILVRLDSDGTIVSQRTTATLIQKL